MIQRATDDRREHKLKVKNDNRLSKRRKEDKYNILSYYIVLGISLSFFMFIAIISFVWGR